MCWRAGLTIGYVINCIYVILRLYGKILGPKQLVEGIVYLVYGSRGRFTDDWEAWKQVLRG